MSDNIRRIWGGAPVTAHMERIPAKDLEGNWSMVICFGCAAQRFNLKATDDDHLQLNGCCSAWCCLCFPLCSKLTRIEGTNNFKSDKKGDPLSFASADAMMPDYLCCGKGPKCTNAKKHPDTTRTFPPCM